MLALEALHVAMQDGKLQHASATMQWAEVERELLTLLHACTAEQQAERFKEAAKRYDEANSSP